MITVTFHNVMVEALEATEPMRMSILRLATVSPAQITLPATIQVIPPKLGNVTVTPRQMR